MALDHLIEWLAVDELHDEVERGGHAEDEVGGGEERASLDCRLCERESARRLRRAEEAVERGIVLAEAERRVHLMRAVRVARPGLQRRRERRDGQVRAEVQAELRDVRRFVVFNMA